MPFVSNMQDEEQKPDQATTPQGGISPTGGGSSTLRLAPSAAVPSGGAGTGGSPNTAGGSFASIGQYLNANQGQAEPLANKLTAGIGQQYNTLAGQNTATLNDINSQVAANAVPANANATLAQEAANPVSFASNPSNIPSFQKLLGATYSGPASAESTAGYTNQQNAINNAIATGQQNTKTEAGRENLISQNEATPTSGVTALNSAILSQSPTALRSVEKAYDPYANLLSGLSSGAQDINKQIASNQNAATSTSAAANKQIADQINALNTNVNSEYGQLQNQYNAANTEASNLASTLQGGTLPTGYGVDPGLSQFISQQVSPWFAANAPNQPASYNFANAVPQFTTNAAPTLPQAATAQEYNQAQAFQNLLAGLPAGPAAPIISPATASQAGTYNTADLPTVNNQLLAGDIESGLQSANANINTSAKPYEQFLGLIQALNNYQNNGQNAYGSFTPPGAVIPTIA